MIYDKIAYKSNIINSLRQQNKKMQYMDVLLSYTESSDPEQFFQLLDILGQGAYGSVSKALHKQTGELYAIKILPATSVNEISVIKKQIAILRQCNDQHIVKYYGSYFKDNNLWIVMEYCMAGSITDIVNITDIQLTESQIASILELVLKGLKYLHGRKKIHRDIKAANILLDQYGTAKLADFGVSTEMMYTNARHNTHIGSPYWMSPEVIKYSEYNQKTDIWSLGVTAIELAEGVVPYSHLKPFMAMWTMKDKPIQGFKQPQNWSVQFNNFVQMCLKINPQQRPNAQDLLHHEFIRKNSKGKKILQQLVQNSMGEIENFRAGQAHNQEFDKNELKEIIFSKGDSNGSEYESRTVIVKGSDKKGSEGVESVIEHSGNSMSFKKQVSEGAVKKNLLSEEYEQNDDSGSVVIKDSKTLQKSNVHSRNCSEISVSSVLVKEQEEGSNSEIKSKQNTNFFKSYVQNMQAIQSKEQQFRQSVQEKIYQIQEQFIKQMLGEYSKAKNQLKEFFIEDNDNNNNKTNNSNQNNNNNKLGSKKAVASSNQQQKQAKTFQSKLYQSSSLLSFLYNNASFLQQKQQLQEEFKQKYLSSIQPVENNYMSMMLESGNDEGSGEYNHNLMQFINDDNDSENHQVENPNHSRSNGTFLKHSGQLVDQFRKKSQSSADSPTSLFHNKKKHIKKLIIQDNLQDPNSQLGINRNTNLGLKKNTNLGFNRNTDLGLNKDTSSINTEPNYTHHNSSLDKNPKQNTLIKFLQKTPTIPSQNASKTNSKYKQVFLNSANFTNTNNKSLMSTVNYPHSTTTNLRNQKRVITTQPHQAYQYQTDSLSTLTKLHTRNLKQFYDDPVVMNNLKQLTQGSEQYHGSLQLNPFDLKKNSFSKQIKSVKSKEKDNNKVNLLRQKQRATHIAHIAMAHNNRTVTNSNKKLKVVKVIEEREKSPQDFNNQSTKTAKTKKSKSKNKQTASTTIPFGSVGNIGALEFVPSKIAKSKQKKSSQIPIKTGPFSKIKNKN